MRISVRSTVFFHVLNTASLLLRTLISSESVNRRWSNAILLELSIGCGGCTGSGTWRLGVLGLLGGMASCGPILAHPLTDSFPLRCRHGLSLSTSGLTRAKSLSVVRVGD